MDTSYKLKHVFRFQLVQAHSPLFENVNSPPPVRHEAIWKTGEIEFPPNPNNCRPPTQTKQAQDERGRGEWKGGRIGRLSPPLFFTFPCATSRRATWSLSRCLSLSASLAAADGGVVADAGAKRSDSTKNLNAVNGSSLARRKDRRRWRHCEIYPPDFNFKPGNKRRERGWIIESETKSHGCAIPTFDQRWPLNTGRVLVYCNPTTSET